MESENKTDQITADMLPDDSVTVLIKYKGKLYAKGGLMEELRTDDGVYRSMARTKNLLHGMLMTIFYTLGHKSQELNMDMWYEAQKRTRRQADRTMGVVQEDE